jgi:hypothetical protein
MCGSMLEGAAFSKLRMQQDQALLNAAQGASREAQAKVIQQSQQLHELAYPQCTEWMTAD